MFISFMKMTKESHGEIWIHYSDFSIGIPNPRICFQGVIPKPKFIKEIIYLKRHRIYSETFESLNFFSSMTIHKIFILEGMGSTGKFKLSVPLPYRGLRGYREEQLNVSRTPVNFLSAFPIIFFIFNYYKIIIKESLQ